MKKILLLAALLVLPLSFASAKEDGNYHVLGLESLEFAAPVVGSKTALADVAAGQIVYETGTGFWGLTPSGAAATASSWVQLSLPAGANNFVAQQVNTGAAISGSVGSFQTFSTGQSLVFAPSVSGTYKVYASMPLQPGPGDNVPFAGRIFNTSGGATLLYESQVLVNGFKTSVTNPASSGFAQSVYTLTAGTAYVFDLQGEVLSTGTLTLETGSIPIYIFAELIH
jgi:hypothetical protein